MLEPSCILQVNILFLAFADLCCCTHIEVSQPIDFHIGKVVLHVFD